MQKIVTVLFLLLIFINISYVTTGVLFHPVQSMDAIGIWFFKAKAFYIEQGFPNNFLHNANYAYSHQRYPLGLPFIIFLFYRLMGGVNDHSFLILYPISYCLILLLVYKIFRRHTNTIYSLIFVYIYSMFSPLIAAGGRILAGNADIFLVLVEWIFIYILYKKKFSIAKCILIMILVMIASQIKFEGIFLSGILLFLPVSRKLRISLFCVSLTPIILWTWVTIAFKIPTDTHPIVPSLFLAIERMAIIAFGIIRELGNINNWYIFWVLVLLSVLIKQKISPLLKQTLLPAYFLMMFLYVLVYLFASNNTNEYISSSFDRVLFQQSALVFLFFFEKMITPTRELFDRLLKGK